MRRIAAFFLLTSVVTITGISCNTGTAQEPQQRQRKGRTSPDDVTVLRDVVYGTGGGRDLTMHIVLPKENSDAPMPAYVWVHGGGWQGGTKEGGVGQVLPLVREGFIGATIEYRLTGEAPFPAQIEDCKCAIRYLRAHAEKYNLDPKRIAVGGSSAGGHLVALLGTSSGVPELEGMGGWAEQSSAVQAVVDLYGPTDFKAFVTTAGYTSHNRAGSPESKLLGGGEVLSNEAGIRRVNPITYVDKTDPPFLIIHGTDDRTVPVNQSEALHNALKSVDVESTLHIIEGAGHGGPAFAKPEVRSMQRSFLLQHLKHALFDGETLNGWKQLNGTATYEVVDGTIVGTTVEGSWNSFLCTEKQYGDFELEFEVRADPRLNSGVQIRSTLRDKTIGEGPNLAEGRVIGPQVEIESSKTDGAEAGYIYAEATGNGWLTPKERLKPHKHFKDGEWNHFRILAQGPRIQTWINGVAIEDLTDEETFAEYPRGFIGLQVHRVRPGAGPYSVAWRNIRLKEVAPPF